MRPVIGVNGCVGFVVRHRHQFAAYSADEKQLGIFATECDAVAAVLAAEASQID